MPPLIGEGNFIGGQLSGPTYKATRHHGILTWCLLENGPWGKAYMKEFSTEDLVYLIKKPFLLKGNEQCNVVHLCC